MVMSFNEDLPCGFRAADDFQSCQKPAELPDAESVFCALAESDFWWNFDRLHNCTCKSAFSFDVTAVTMTNNDVQQRDLDWPLFQWTRMSNPTELPISAEDEKSWFCDFVPKVMCNQKDEGSGEASTKTSKLHLHQVTTKMYHQNLPKNSKYFQHFKLSIHVAKKLLGARFGSSSSLWCNLVSEAWRQAATALHSYPPKEIWYFHVAREFQKFGDLLWFVCSPRCHACWKSEVFFGGCWWGPQWNWLWPRFCTESRGEELNPEPESAYDLSARDICQNHDKKVRKTVQTM